MADMEAFQNLAQTHNLAMVEDCAQAIDSSWLGKKAGTWGELGTFSFQANKTITAGEGGLVMTNDAGLAEKVMALRAFGRFVQNGDFPKTVFRLCFPNPIQQLPALANFRPPYCWPSWISFPHQDERRQANADRLTRGLPEIPGIRPIRREAPVLQTRLLLLSGSL